MRNEENIGNKPENAESNEPYGMAKVKNMVQIAGVGNVADCRLIIGIVRRESRVRVIRSRETIMTGLEVESLRRFQQEIFAVIDCSGFGIRLAGFDQIEIGDIFEFY